MRIISQDGNTNAPYEMIVIDRSENLIFMRGVNETTTGKVIAQYTTGEKAQKAMILMRDICYGSFREKIKTMQEWEKKYFEKAYGERMVMPGNDTYEMENGYPIRYFQFPAEEELE